MSVEFVHLHNHSDYSLLDGAQTISSIINTMSDLNMESVAITEHGNLFSTINFYKDAKKAGIKPIIGCEIYVAQGSRFDKKPKASSGWGNNHLVLLVQNYTGYKNLIKLVTVGFLEGFYYRPRVDKDLMKQYNEGLICLSACLKGEVQELAVNGDYEGAKKVALEYSEIFPGRFYLELQNHKIPEEDVARNIIKKLADELDIPLVATNDCHYSRKEDWEAHDIMFCLGTGKSRSDPNRQRYATPEFYFKSQDEMWKSFKDYKNAMENSRLIADSCNLEIPLGETLLPTFPMPEESKDIPPDLYLEKLCFDQLHKLYSEVTPELENRLKYELGIINKTGFTGYFLIVWDFVKYAKDKDIPVGPGRGSVAGSLVAYTLGITTIDPLKYHLLFERFLNPDRITMPDIDIDFCYERRGEVIDYIKSRYGEDSVTQIITFGKLKARQVVRDVGRVLGLDYSQVDKIAKMIPFGPGVSLNDALKINPELQQLVKSDEVYSDIIKYSKTLEGMNRHASTHAAGIVITPGKLTDHIPLYKSTQGDITSQFDMKGLEDLGLLKMDFLGLRNLTVIDKTVSFLKERGINLDIEIIGYDDPEIYKIFTSGNTVGIFQFESTGMREYLKKLKPSCIEDLIAMNALYRPGPMENIDEFIKRKHGRKKTRYIHPKLEPILKETYGIIVYQEQVMQITHSISGFSLGQADLLRRAIGKKQKSLMKAQRNKFIDGAGENNIEKTTAEEIFDLIEKFAKYGFNKSHSTAYAIIAYQTAYLKTYHPAEFMAANLTSEITNTTRVVTLISECQKMGINIHPPDINESEITFKALDEKNISFGLNAIKNVGSKAAENIVTSRKEFSPFKTIYDFCEHLDLRLINKKVLESLVASGATDSLKGTRAQQYGTVEQVLKFSHRIQSEANDEQVGLFGISSVSSEIHKIPSLSDIEKWPESELLKKENEVMGFYLTGHPLLKYANKIEEFSNYDFFDKDKEPNGREIQIAGTVENIKIHIDKKNHPMGFFQLDCLGGKAEITAFHDIFKQYKHLIKEGELVFVKGKSSASFNDNTPKVIANKIHGLADFNNNHIKKVNITIDVEKIHESDVEDLFNLTRDYKGISPIYFHLKEKEQENPKIILSKNVKVMLTKELLTKLKEKFGDANVWVEE